MSEGVWAAPRKIARLEDCYFYHTMDVPGHGTVRGEWDLRGRESDYIGNVNVAGKRVLEIGTASGHLCFAMERMGAEVVAYDLSDEHDWDIVPFAAVNQERRIAERRAHIRRINNGYWLAHDAYRSRARVAYGTAYAIPDGVGQFDICTLGSILLHLRDPFAALARAASRVRETMVVTDVSSGLSGRLLGLAEVLTGKRMMGFLPDPATRRPLDAWWKLTPGLVADFLRILGFPRITTTYHRQRYRDGGITLYTVVGRRAEG